MTKYFRVPRSPMVNVNAITCWIWISLVLVLVLTKDCATELRQAICIRDKSELKLKSKSNPNSEDGFKQIPYIDERPKIQYPQMVAASTVFVDKSLLIKTILETEQKVVLINCPPRTGKSVNLSMLKAFFEIRVRKRDDLRIVPQTQTSTYKFFTQGKIINSANHRHQFDSPLQSTSTAGSGGKLYRNDKSENVFATYTNWPMIAEYKDIIEQHLAQYPVIYLDLVYEEWLLAPTIFEGIKRQIADLYRKHAFLKEMMKQMVSGNRTSGEKKIKAQRNLEQFELVQKACEAHAEINLTVQHRYIENSVLILCKILYEQLGDKPVIILVDEYAQALQHHLLYEHEYYKGDQAAEIRRGIRMLRNFTRQTFAENCYLKKAVLTGTLSVNKKDLFADVSDLVYYNAIDNDLQTFYGFTDNELRMLCDHFEIPRKLAQEARDFYKGYTMKSNIHLDNTTTTTPIYEYEYTYSYNTRSITSFVNKKLIRDYWIRDAKTFDKMLTWLDMAKLGTVLRPLVDGKATSMVFTELDFGTSKSLHYWSRTRQHQKQAKISKKAVDCILSLFCQIGLLTNSAYVEQRRKMIRSIYIRIPNEEVRSKLEKHLPR